MKCKNCGTDNPDDVERCEKCGKRVNESKYRICWIPVGIGAAVGVILLFLLRALMGNGNLLLATFIPWVMLSGFVATVLSYDKNVRAGYDFNPLISGIIAGSIAGLLILAGTPVDYSGISVIGFSSIIGCVFWAFAGTIIGIIVNLIREKDKRLFIPTIIIIAAVLLSIGYISNSMTTNWDFEAALNNEYIALAEGDLLKVEADYFLNKSYSSENQHEKNLKEAQKRYNKVIEFTSSALLWNSEALNSSNSDIQKEFFLSMEKYIELKLQYYTLNKEAIDIEIKGKTKQAQAKYKEAQKLLPKIKAQEKIVTSILQKDTQLEKEVESIKESTLGFAKHEQENGELLTTYPPTKMPES